VAGGVAEIFADVIRRVGDDDGELGVCRLRAQYLQHIAGDDARWSRRGRLGASRRGGVGSRCYCLRSKTQRDVAVGGLAGGDGFGLGGGEARLQAQADGGFDGVVVAIEFRQQRLGRGGAPS